HADRLGSVVAGPRRAAPRRSALAAPNRRKCVGRYRARVRGSAHSRVHALAGVHDAAATGERGHGLARLLAAVRPPATFVDATEGWIRSLAFGALAADRSRRRDAAARPPRHAVRAGAGA